MYKITANFNPVEKLSNLTLRHQRVKHGYLESMLLFQPSILTRCNDDPDINGALDILMPLLKAKKRIKIDVEKESMEYQVLQELVLKLLNPLSSSIVLESRKHTSWVSRNFDERSDFVSVGNLGMGSKETTWYGTPDGRLRGFSSDSDVAFLSNEEDEEPESDGASVNLEVKRVIKHESQAIGTAVVASFTENSLHPSLNSLVPCILLNCNSLQVYMYDCVSDVLMITEKVSFRQGPKLEKSSMLFLWLFINHRYRYISS